MKNFLTIAGGILFDLGLCMATGAEENPVQNIYAVLLIGGACVCFNTGRKAQSKTISMEPNKKLEDAA